MACGKPTLIIQQQQERECQDDSTFYWNIVSFKIGLLIYFLRQQKASLLLPKPPAINTLTNEP